MKRIIVDYRKVPIEVLNILREKYPDGYHHEDTMSFKKSNGDWIRALEVVLNDTVYLVRVNDSSNNGKIVDIDHLDLE